MFLRITSLAASFFTTPRSQDNQIENHKPTASATKEPTRRSSIMDELYGIEMSKKIFKRFEDLDTGLNADVQNSAYGYYWSLPGLSLRDKSLITNVSLIISGFNDQLRGHLYGFINVNGTDFKSTITMLLSLLSHISENYSEERGRNGLSLLMGILTDEDLFDKDIVAYSSQLSQKTPSYHLSENDFHLIEISAAVASRDFDKIDASILHWLKNHDANDHQIRNIMRHLAIYCGYPTVINGFSRLSKILEEHPGITDKASMCTYGGHAGGKKPDKEKKSFESIFDVSFRGFIGSYLMS